MLLNRRGVGIELNEKWVRLGRERLRAETPCPDGQKVVMGDSRRIMKTMAGESFDYVITSPPYWNILSKDTHENKRKGRRTEGLDTSYGKSCDDLGNISDYSEFLHELSACFSECYRVLRDGRYATLIVSDFRDGARARAFPQPCHGHVPWNWIRATRDRRIGAAEQAAIPIRLPVRVRTQHTPPIRADVQETQQGGAPIKN